jgi:hypothetical protein
MLRLESICFLSSFYIKVRFEKKRKGEALYFRPKIQVGSESKLAYYAISYSKEGQYLTAGVESIRKLKDLPMTREGTKYLTYTNMVPAGDVELREGDKSLVSVDRKNTTTQKEILNKGRISSTYRGTW